MKQHFYITRRKSPYGFDVKRKCNYLYQVQYCNVSCVLDYKPLLYKGRWYYDFILLLTCLIMYYKFFLVFFVSCPCMADNAGYLPGIILLTQNYYHRGTPLNASMKRLFVFAEPITIPPKRFNIFSPLTGRCSEGLDAFRFIFKQQLLLLLYYLCMCPLLFWLFFVSIWTYRFFRVFLYHPLPSPLCLENTSYVFPFLMVFFYPGTKGSIFYMSLLYYSRYRL